MPNATPRRPPYHPGGTPKKPKLGQNFLVDDAARHRIADALGDVSESTVIEIGPGHGAITAILAGRARRLICVELDRSLAAELRFRYRERSSVSIVEGDILETDFEDLLRSGGPYADDQEAVSQQAPHSWARAVGNLPYYITSDILLHLCAAAASLETAVVMMQREVADRVAAQPGTRDYGLLSVTVQMHAEIANLFTLPPTAFSPQPDVYSSVLRLSFRSRFAELGIRDGAAWTGFLRGCFQQKRKMLSNNLRSSGFTATEVIQACERAAISPDTRAEALSVEALAGLYRSLAELSGAAPPRERMATEPEQRRVERPERRPVPEKPAAPSVPEPAALAGVPLPGRGQSGG